MKPWTTLDSTEIVADRWLRLTADKCELQDGKIVEPYYVIHEKDWVHVFAQTVDARLLVVRQYRYAAGAVCAELPGGIVDDNETPLDAAKRELLEETGYTADEWVSVGRMYANPARQTNAVHLFYARNVEQIANQSLDHGEELSFQLASLQDVENMIDSGEFSQSLHIASYYRVLTVLARGY